MKKPVAILTAERRTGFFNGLYLQPLCVAEMGGFELPKPWCGLRDFQSRALDQLGDISSCSITQKA